MSEQIINATDATFDELINSETPVLVDYWAEWCAPCRALAPALEEIAGEMSEQLKVAKVNIDDNREVAVKMGIRGIPTLMIFKNGKTIGQHVGALSKSDLAEFVKKATA